MCDENVIEYDVVTAHKLSLLETQINDRLAEGWKLRGELHQFTVDSTVGYLFAQVMVKVSDANWAYIGANSANVQIPENTLYGRV